VTESSQDVDAPTELLIAKVSGNPVAMLMLARTLLVPRGKTVRALALCDDALRLAPGDREVWTLAQSIRSRAVGGWYFSMVEDRGRHSRYAEAFREVLTPGCTVLDIGAGTGLFAMLAAREGAGKVIACERDPVIAAAAREIVELNGYSDRVEVIAKDSRQLEIGDDIDDRADVLLWDNLSNDAIGVGALETLDDARRRLLKPGADIIPRGCEIRLALVHTNSGSARMGIVEGFDLTPFNRFRPSGVTVSRKSCERRSDCGTIFDFDFMEDEFLASRRGRTLVTANGGSVDGIVQWLRFRVSENVIYDTGDDEGVTAFGLQYHAVEPFETEPGQQIAICGAHDRQRTWFWIE
jgi:SAM-dependent methyltransferase